MAKDDKSTPPALPEAVKPPVPTPKPPKEPLYECLHDGAIYALTVVSNDPYGKTHKATTEGRLWEGTATEFRAQFERL